MGRGRGTVQDPSSAEAPEKKGPQGWVWRMGRGGGRGRGSHVAGIEVEQAWVVGKRPWHLRTMWTLQPTQRVNSVIT